MTYSQFEGVCAQWKANFTVDELKFLFDQFDREKNGRFDYNAFLFALRGEMNEERREVTAHAFATLRQEYGDQIEIEHMVKHYRSAQHPAVVEGRKTEETVLSEFLEALELFHRTQFPDKWLPEVSEEEFFRLHSEISACIDDDLAFVKTISAVWGIHDREKEAQKAYIPPSPGPSSYKYHNTDPYGKASSAVDPTLRSGLESADNPWHTTDSYYNHGSPMKGRQISNPKHDREFRIQHQITG